MKDTTRKFILLTNDSLDDDDVTSEELKRVFEVYEKLKVSQFLTSDSALPNTSSIEVEENLFYHLSTWTKSTFGAIPWISRLIPMPEKNLVVLAMSYEDFCNGVKSYRDQIREAQKDLINSLNDVGEELELLSRMDKEILQPLSELIYPASELDV